MHRIILSILLAILFESFAFSQLRHVAFSENFNSGKPKWILINDSNTAVKPPFKDAWVQYEDETPGDSCAASTSYFVDKAKASRWMIFGPIKVNEEPVLYWQAQASNFQFPDGYSVYAESKIEDFNDKSTPIFTIAEERDYWTNRSAALNGFGFIYNEVYIAFKQNSYNKDVLLIDDIFITDTTGINSDFKLMSDSTRKWLNVTIPYGQNTDKEASVVVQNSGKKKREGSLKIDVMNAQNDVVSSRTLKIPQLEPGETYRAPVQNFEELIDTGIYRILFELDRDDCVSNNTQELDLEISDRFSTARAEKVKPFIIDYFEEGKVGTSYTYYRPDTIVAIEYQIDNRSGIYTGLKVHGAIYGENAKGKFSVKNLLVKTDTVTIDSAADLKVYLPTENPFPLSSDTQTRILVSVDKIALEQLPFLRDKGVQVENGSRNFVYYGSITNHDFVSASQLKVNGNFGVTAVSKSHPCYLDVTYQVVKQPTVYEFTGVPKADSIQKGEVLIKSINNGVPPYTAKYEKGGNRKYTTFTVPGTISYGEPYKRSFAGLNVEIKDANGCLFVLFLSENSRTEYIENMSSIGYIIKTMDVEVWPNPAESRLHFFTNLNRSSVLIYDLNGKKMLEEMITETNEIDISSIPAGIYMGSIQQNGVSGYFRFIKK